MGCFFACFRIKVDERQKNHLVSNPIPSKSWDPVVSKNQLASVFLCDGKGSSYEQTVNLCSRESIDKDGVDGELKNEAKFLKSIGTLDETPPEIRKASEKIYLQTTSEKDPSSVPSCKKLDWDERLGQVPDSPAQLHEKSRKSEGCESEEHQALRKSVLYESELECVNLDVSLFQSDCHIVSSHSPYPTPTNLTDEMQTPGTVYQSNLETVRTAKNPRIHTQFVYPVSNHVENSTQWKADSSQNQETSSVEDKSWSSVVTPLSSSRQQVNFDPDSPQLLVTNFSHWLRPPVAKERSHSERSPDAERPIIGLVAAHWNDDDSSRIPPKWWDGNGIPNSTNKYKEDQKVSWHATPFEVRLEKALSDEKLCPQRKHLEGKPIDLNVEEGEESDTAAS